MRRLLAVLAMLACVSPALGQDDGACAVASALVVTDAALPNVATAVKKARRLEIVVVGTGSSILAGPSGGDIAYPARLQAVLTQRLPGVDVRVASLAKPRRTAAEMSKEFRKVLTGSNPALVIWQTGTVDAMRGVDPDDFRAALEEGVGELHTAGADAILVNMQYSPRTESMIAINTYADNMRWVAQHRDIPLFDRFAIMKTWSEVGTFDFHTATSSVETAGRVHGCIGQLLADLIMDAAKLTPTPKASQ